MPGELWWLSVAEGQKGAGGGGGPRPRVEEPPPPPPPRGCHAVQLVSGAMCVICFGALRLSVPIESRSGNAQVCGSECSVNAMLTLSGQRQQRLHMQSTP